MYQRKLNCRASLRNSVSISSSTAVNVEGVDADGGMRQREPSVRRRPSQGINGSSHVQPQLQDVTTATTVELEEPCVQKRVTSTFEAQAARFTNGHGHGHGHEKGVVGEDEADGLLEELKKIEVDVTLDFELYFKWLEIMLWVTMAVGIIWALVYNFSRATREYCELKHVDEHGKEDYIYPFNILPSLSRSMSSFRIGLAIWTISMAVVFVARLLATHFLHRMYKSWFQDSYFNYVFLKFIYVVEIAEIISLIMIPAFSLDCDPTFHSLFFYIFICLTFTAEILQWTTKFLRRKEGLVLDSEVDVYYKHIGWLVLLQGFFIGFMIAVNLLHKYYCVDYLYSAFAIGEYVTVIINIRFKRETIKFVR